MSYLLVFLNLLPTLIGVVEKLMPGSGQGEVKKSWVKETGHQIIQSVGEVSTGGQKETAQKIDNIIDPVIDGMVAVANKFGWTNIINDDTAKWGM